MKLAIIGAGNVGATLGSRFTEAGHTVTYGRKEPGSTQDAVNASDIVILATPWDAVEDIIKTTQNWENKIIIDATNPVAPNLSGLTLGTTTSAAEHVAQWAPHAKVVKAFNTIGSNIMANPDFGTHKVALFYCGDDKPSKQVVHQLAAELGFEPHDAGPLTQARVLEPFALLWISLAFVAGFGRDIAFQFLTRP